MRYLERSMRHQAAPESHHRLTRGDLAIAVGVVALALLTRLLFLASMPDRTWPHSVLYEGDAPVWVEYAQHLRDGVPFEYGLMLRSPAVAHVLDWCAGPLSGDALIGSGGFVRLKVLWCLISALTCGVACLLATATVGRLAGLVAAGVLCFAFDQYVLAISLNNEALYSLLLFASAGAMAALTRRPGWTIAAAAGVAHGLATLTRPEHPLALLLLLGMVAWRWRRTPRVAAPHGERHWRRFAMAGARLGVVALVCVAVCLPWSVAGSLAAARYNVTERQAVSFDTLAVPWTADARAAIARLPAFARPGNVGYCTALARQAGLARIDAEVVARYFAEQFGYTPEPLSTWQFVSMQGPLSFALANHPEADGGFSKVALDSRLNADPKLSPSQPLHLRLINDGYRVGWGWIAEDPGRWLELVGRKLVRFAGGATTGMTAYDIPLGRDFERPAVDMVVTAGGVWYRAVWGILLVIGGVACVVRRVGGVWLLIVAYKLIVTVMFYGYARQAASIGPALAVLAAIGLVTILGPVGRKLRVSRGVWRWLAAIVVVGALGADITNAVRGARFQGRGDIVPTPQLGNGAFTASGVLRVKLVPAE